MRQRLRKAWPIVLLLPCLAYAVGAGASVTTQAMSPGGSWKVSCPNPLSVAKLSSSLVQLDCAASTTSTTTVPPSGGSLVLEGTTKGTGNFGGGVTVGVPRAQAGDLLVAVAGSNGSPSAWSTPTGWAAGSNSAASNTQGLDWWWKFATGTDKSVTLKSSSWADGGAVVLDYRGAGALPIGPVSTMVDATSASTVRFNGVSWTGSASVVPLLLASWQARAATVTEPVGFGTQAEADDGFGFVSVAAGAAVAATDLPAQTATYSSPEAVVNTLQVAILLNNGASPAGSPGVPTPTTSTVGPTTTAVGPTTTTVGPTTSTVGPTTTVAGPTTTVGPVGGGGRVSVGFDVAFDLAPSTPWADITQDDLFALETTAGSGLDTASESVDQVNVPQWVAAVHANHRLALITIGGIDDQHWQTACDSTYRSAFVANLVSYMKSNGFDGIDLDIEDDAWSAETAPVAAWDGCVQAIANAAHATTTAAGARPLVSEDVTTNWMGSYVADDVAYVDQFNLMTYGDTCVGGCSTFASDVQDTYTQGLPKAKMVLGIDLIDSPSPQVSDPADCGSIASYAVQQGLMGTMVWDIHSDDGIHNGCLNQIASHLGL